MLYNFLSVAIGGALGAMARYGIAIYATSPALGLPAFMATLSVNIIGCALMGVMAAIIQLFPVTTESWRPFIMTGFLGALTTFSSFALDLSQLLEKQDYGVLLFYFTASFIASLGAFFLFFHLSKWGLG